MNAHGFFALDASVLALMLFVVCILMVVTGKGIRNRFLKDEQESKGGVNSLLAALFGLWAFILAFTFSNASSRFENVRTMMVDEANIIRNVFLRSEAFPDSVRAAFLQDLKGYLQARIDYYEQANDAEKFNKAKQDAATIGKRLWTRTIQVGTLPNLGITSSNMLATLSSMYDIGAKRDAVLLAGIPAPISFVLFFIAMVISFVGGITSPVLKPKEWVVITGFIFLACFIIYITIDLARPMEGFIRPDVGQQRIVDLQKLFAQ